MAINMQGGDDEPWDTEEPADSAPAAETAQLELEDGDEPLPWLEGDEDYDESGVDSGRIAAFAIIGLVVIGLIVGAIWLATRERGDPSLVPDGSTIAAPDEPYKTKPDEPGGKTFEGTGDTSFAVAEGQSREGQLASEDMPRPSLDAATGENTDGSQSTSAGVGVQVGAYVNRSTAEQGWRQLVSGLGHRVVEGQADIGTVYRLQALAPDLEAANELCDRLKAAGGACQVKR